MLLNNAGTEPKQTELHNEVHLKGKQRNYNQIGPQAQHDATRPNHSRQTRLLRYTLTRLTRLPFRSSRSETSHQSSGRRCLPEKPKQTTVSPNLTVYGAHETLSRRLFFHGALHRNRTELSSRPDIDTIRKLKTTASLLSLGRPIRPPGSQPKAKPGTTTET
ncbi:Uncharacterized protein Rs2_20959 [Raphanus sativus]|nr:Uncharacterized protein Rs2_20959 [Raphanus sativus]